MGCHDAEGNVNGLRVGATGMAVSVVDDMALFYPTKSTQLEKSCKQGLKDASTDNSFSAAPLLGA